MKLIFQSSNNIPSKVCTLDYKDIPSTPKTSLRQQKNKFMLKSKCCIFMQIFISLSVQTHFKQLNKRIKSFFLQCTTTTKKKYVKVLTKIVNLYKEVLKN